MKSDKVISRVLIFFYLSIPYFPLFGEIDRIASQWAFFSGLNFLSLIFIYFKYEKKFFQFALFKPVIFYLFFIIFCLISITKSTNITESFVEFFRYFSVFLALISLPLLASKFNNKSFLISVLIVFSVVDIAGIFLQLNYNLPLIGFTGNKNIASASLLLKSNAIIFLLYKYKNLYIKLFSFLFSCFAFSAVLLIGSKAGILTAIIITLLLTVVSFFKRPIFLSNFIVVGAFLTSIGISFLFNDNFKNAVNDTVNYTNDTGSTDRLRYYSQAFQTFKENPFFGIGLGNWKIYSSKYDSINMKDYIVQYHTHNDYLQLLAEIGVFGALFYFLFFIYFFWIIYIHFKKLFPKENIEQLIVYKIGLLCVIVYFIDSNLNFPAARVVMQINLASTLALILMTNKNKTNSAS